MHYVPDGVEQQLTGLTNTLSLSLQPLPVGVALQAVQVEHTVTQSCLQLLCRQWQYTLQAGRGQRSGGGD